MIKRDGEGGIRWRREYDSLQELFGVTLSSANQGHSVANTFLTEAEAQRADWAQAPDRLAWRGGYSSLEGYKGFVNAGWAEGVKKMRETIGALQVPAVMSVKRRQTWREEGDEIDMGRVYSGELDSAWRGTVRRECSGGTSHVRILVAATSTHQNDPSKLFWRGAVACLLTDALENAGYRVEVVMFEQSGRTFWDSDSELDRLSSVPLKRFDEALDIERMASLTAHASGLRVAWFAETLSTPYRVNGNMGTPNHNRPAIAEENDIVIDGLWNLAQARAFLGETLAKFGE